jgi:peptidoglycan/LPS O-acetylase OafA/YrhL
MVVAFHAGLPVPGGFVGVDVFFVISGFVITSMLRREWTATGRIRLGRFYLRRFKRLTPALALVVAVTVVASYFVLSALGPQQTAAKTAIGAMLISANYVIASTTGGYFDAPAATNPLLHTWSLSVEEQFYLAFPALLALGWLLARRRLALWAPALLVAAVAAASFVLALAGTSGGSDLLGFYSSLTRAWEFSVGALVALALPRLAVASRRVGSALALLGAAGLVASLFMVSEQTPFPGVWTLLPVTGTALLLLAGSGTGNGVNDQLSRDPLVLIGDWSYSIYLWHWPTIVFATVLWPDLSWAALAAAVLSFLPAALSYNGVEQPIRSIPRLSRRGLVLLVTLTIVPPLVLAGLLLVRSQRTAAALEEQAAEETAALQQPAPAQTAQQTAQAALYAAASPVHLGNESGCHTPEPITERSASDCTWNESAPGYPIYLVGDSNADHLSEAVVGAGEALERPVTVATIDTCPFFDVYVERLSRDEPFFEPCRTYYEQTLSWLLEQPPGLVVISNSDEIYLDPDVEIGLTPDTMTSDPVQKAADRTEGVTATVEALQEAGHDMLLVQTVPHFVGDFAYEPDLCSAASINAGTCAASMPRSVAEETQRLPREALAEAGARTDSVVLDLWDVLCSEDICTTRSDDLVRYRDSFHISVPESQSLVPLFAQVLPRAG